MTTKAVESVFGTPHPSAPVQLVLVALAWRTTPGNEIAEASYLTLSRMIGLSPRAVGRAVARAVADTYLEVAWARPGRGTRYRINLGEHRISGPAGNVVLTRGADVPPTSQPSLFPVDNPPDRDGKCSTGGAPVAPQVGHAQSDYQGKRDLDTDKSKREKGAQYAAPVEKR
jgi:hypothetical protein